MWDSQCSPWLSGHPIHLGNAFPDPGLTGAEAWFRKKGTGQVRLLSGIALLTAHKRSKTVVGDYICMYVCTCMSAYAFFLDQLIEFGGKKRNPFSQSTATVCRRNEGNEPEQLSLVSSSIRQNAKRYNCFPASQILLGSRKQDWEMLRLRRKLGIYYLSFCGCYSANIRRRGMKETAFAFCAVRR